VPVDTNYLDLLPGTGIQHEPLSIYSQTSGSVSEASVKYTETLPGEYYELSNVLIDRSAGINLPHSEDVEVSSAFIEDTKTVLDPNYNMQDNFAYSNHAPGYVSSYNARPVAFPAPATVNLSGQNALPAPALHQTRFSGFNPTTTVGPTHPPGANTLTCPLGCRGTFGRPSEYQRHWRRHEGRSYPCMQPGCSRSFHRKDKLRDHLRQGHKITHPERAHAAAVTGVQSAAASSGLGQM
jgi:hypothetical protein